MDDRSPFAALPDPEGFTGTGDPLRDYARDIAKKYNIRPELVAAVIGTESAWNPRAVSRAGAQGLMQLMPQTAQSLGVQDPFNP